MFNVSLKDVYRELKSNDPASRYEAAIMLGQCERLLNIKPSTEMVSMLAVLLNDDNAHVRYYTAQALGELAFKEAIPFLEKRLLVERPANDGPDPLSAIKEAICKCGKSTTY